MIDRLGASYSKSNFTSLVDSGSQSNRIEKDMIARNNQYQIRQLSNEALLHRTPILQNANDMTLVSMGFHIFDQEIQTGEKKNSALKMMKQFNEYMKKNGFQLYAFNFLFGMLELFHFDELKPFIITIPRK